MPKFIVISGKKQAGKTTTANSIRAELENRGLNVHITSFAAPIKDFCTDIIGLSEAQVYGTNEQKNSPTHIRWNTMPVEILTKYIGYGIPLKSNKFMSAREVMQIFGTDIMRQCFDYDIWAKAPFKKYKDSNFDFIIIDDCRFPNEAEASIENNSILIRLTRNVLDEDAHISEKAMDDYPKNKYDYIINNHLYKNIDCLFMDINNIVSKLI